MNTTRTAIRRVLREAPGEKDKLTVEDLHDYDIGKSILIGDTWYTVRRQDKDIPAFKLSVADFEEAPGENPFWVDFRTIARKVNAGEWGFQHKDPRRGREGWFGRHSPSYGG